jgi:hypothetical protein
MLFRKMLILAVILFLIFSTTGAGIANEVSQERARAVAQNWLYHLTESHGFTNSEFIVTGPKIIDEEVMVYKNRVVGYNYILFPRGHIIVPFRDELPPVKLYSDTATLRIAENSVVAEWIKEELFKLYEAMDSRRQELASIDYSSTHNGRLWSLFEVDSSSFLNQYKSAATGTESLSLDPLLSSTWGQGDPYNMYCPLWNTGERTVTGCVATAAAQIIKYWNYPVSGQGSTSYIWNNGQTNVTLSKDFTQSTYQWSLMKNSYSAGGTSAEKDAVAQLMSDIGIAFLMSYGIGSLGGSGANTMYGTTVYPTYFKYKPTISAVYRTSYASDSAWMKVFKNEVQNGRPSQFRIRDPNAGGHSVVVDGYRDSPSEQIHINFGWTASYDGWYVSNNMVTGVYVWSDVNYQGAVIGIEPKSSVVVDLDRDRKTDIAVYDVANGWWFFQYSSTGGYGFDAIGVGGGGQWVPVPGDYDGDHKTDVAVYDAVAGWWLFHYSSGGYFYDHVGQGGTGFTAVPGDYDGDGKTDLAVYQASTGYWFIKYSSGGYGFKSLGGSGKIPVK